MELKIAASLIIGIPAFATFVLLMRDWKYHDKRTNRFKTITRIVLGLVIFGGALGVAYVWLEPHLQARVDERKREELRPSVSVEFSEAPEARLALEIESPEKNLVPIHGLSLKFDIPGKFLSADFQTRNRVEACEIRSEFLAGVGTIVGGEATDVIAETVHLNCRSMYPQGFLRIHIKYEPTRARPVPGSVERGLVNYTYMPLMDLHDYSRCDYWWSHEGQNILEHEYVLLTDLEYIQRDNENLLAKLRHDDFYRGIDEETGGPVESPFAELNEAWLRRMEKERRDW